MKNIILIGFSILILNSCFNNNKEPRQIPKNQIEAVTDIKFNNKIHDFGIVKEDTLLNAKYYFENIGNNDLIIKYVNPDCICTGYSISNDTISPGDSAYIELKFNTKDKLGNQKIYATVRANTQTEMYILILKAKVNSRKDKY